MRRISPDMSAAVVAEIDAVLDAVARDEGVHIPWAIESGSRAWGFPSPDSDYDGRFIYVRPASQALTIRARRDVIETPMTGVLDVNGWDLAKALRLLLKGNAVVVEWLQSPIVYRGTPWFRQALLDFAERRLDRAAVASHYLGVGTGQRSLDLDGRTEGPLKKVFYALRPAAALRWLRLHPDRAVAPMELPTLLQESDPPQEVRAAVAELTRRKAETREMGTGPIPPVLLAFIQTEFEAGWTLRARREPPSSDAVEEADALFKDITLKLDAEAG